MFQKGNISGIYQVVTYSFKLNALKRVKEAYFASTPAEKTWVYVRVFSRDSIQSYQESVNKYISIHIVRGYMRKPASDK